MLDNLVGKYYQFDDGSRITVTQIKIRDDNIPWITYHVSQGPGLPRKLVLKYTEFLDYYGHLFNIKSEDIVDNPDNK